MIYNTVLVSGRNLCFRQALQMIPNVRQIWETRDQSGKSPASVCTHLPLGLVKMQTLIQWVGGGAGTFAAGPGAPL